MSTLPPAIRLHPPVGQHAAWRRLAIVLSLLLLALMSTRKARLIGDSTEYLLMTVAMASHGSVDIRPGDVAQARVLMPPEMKGALDALDRGLSDPATKVPLPGFYRGLDGKVYAIHFPAYSALAVLPFKLLQLAGIDPVKCYQLVNLAAVFVLGLALLRLFGTAPPAGAHPVRRAVSGVALYMLSGGILYWNWNSPECMSAALLLAGFAYYCSSAPIRAGLLIGITSMQNPGAILALGAMPLLAWCLGQQSRPGAEFRAARSPRVLAGLVLGGMLFAVAPLYNLHIFGSPSIIAKYSASIDLLSLARLHSLFFDLSQGMAVAIPFTGMMLLWGWRGMRRKARMQSALALLLCTAISIACAVPAMMMYNWNSAAAGVMRYAFWCAMPLLFFLLWRLHEQPRWPRALLCIVALLQGLAMHAAAGYSAVQFGPVSAFVMRHAPALYNPEPEVFAERAAGREYAVLDPMQVYAFRDDPYTVMKAMRHVSNTDPARSLCGNGLSMKGGTAGRSHHGWLYWNGPLHCTAPLAVTPAHVEADVIVTPGKGWSSLERIENRPAGMWSDGAVSHVRILFPAAGVYRQLTIRGSYFDGNQRTHVIVNGTDMGWHNLETGTALPIPGAASIDSLLIELRHESPHSPGPHDGRRLALFLKQIILQ